MIQDELTSAQVASQLNSQVKTEIFVPTGKTLREQYHNLGTLYADSIRTSAVKLLEYLEDEGQLHKERELAERILIRVRLSQVSQDYLQALSGWSEGAELQKVSRLFHLEPLTLAMMMQNDDAGCQSVLLRTGDGIALLHTEEDDSGPITERVSDHFLIEIDGSITFVYNDLLPGGSAFGVNIADGFAMACDVLRLHPRERGSCLSKIVGWIVWRMGSRATPTALRQVVRELAPFVDGYAMNIVYLDRRGEPRAYRATIGGYACHIDKLGTPTGSAITQVNILDPQVASADPELRVMSLNSAQINKDIEPGYRPGGYYGGYQDRLRWIQQLLEQKQSQIEKSWSGIDPAHLHSEIMGVFGIGAYDSGFDRHGKWNPSNHTVGATFSFFVSTTSVSAGINLGPSLGAFPPTHVL